MLLPEQISVNMQTDYSEKGGCVKTILVAVDFSDATPPAINHAANLAAQFKSKVWLIHVAQPEPDFVGYKAGPQHVRDQVAHEIHREHERLQILEQQMREKGLDASALLIQGPTQEKILQEIERLKVDLVIMGSHGHGAMRHLLVGSVTEGVLRKAPCPVLIIPCHHNAH